MVYDLSFRSFIDIQALDHAFISSQPDSILHPVYYLPEQPHEPEINLPPPMPESPSLRLSPSMQASYDGSAPPVPSQEDDFSFLLNLALIPFSSSLLPF